MRILLSIFIVYLLSACVSKKTFEETLLVHDKEVQNYREQLSFRDKQLVYKKEQFDSLRIEYAEQKGANEALMVRLDKLQDRLDELHNQVVEEQESKTSTEQDLNNLLRRSEKKLVQREQTIDSIKQMVINYELVQEALVDEFTRKIAQFGEDNYLVKIINNEIRISLFEHLLFRPEEVRVRTTGVQNLAIIADLLNAYPSLKMYVVGNTNNQKAKNYKSNLDFSILRAAKVVAILTEEYGVSPSRVIASGIGEFAPIASNETGEGQQQNQRIDFIVTSKADRVLKDLRRMLEN